MKIVTRALLISIQALILIACKNGGGGSGQQPGRPPAAPQPDSPTTDCREFALFHRDFVIAQKEDAAALLAQPAGHDRHILAGGLWASRRRASGASITRESFLQEIGWAFDRDGSLRQVSTHPLLKTCLKE